jgi:hypothetical protein
MKLDRNSSSLIILPMLFQKLGLNGSMAALGSPFPTPHIYVVFLLPGGKVLRDYRAK